MSVAADELADPRNYPAASVATAEARALFELAERALGAATAREADAANAAIRETMIEGLGADGRALAEVLAAAPSPAVARHLGRVLDAAWVAGLPAEADGLAVTLFAVPLVVVAALDRASEPRSVPGTLPSPDALAAILREHRALAGNRNFALSDALVSPEALEVARLALLHPWRALPDAGEGGAVAPPPALAPAPIAVTATHEAVHLRYLVGSALARSGADLLASADARGWGIPLTQELARQLRSEGVSLLVMPRAPARPVPALRIGRVARREVGAQVFVGNALRRLRAAAGEPLATISAHRAAEAPCGGELRLSLSSPFDAREAEGFRCPLYAEDRLGDVVTMLVDLLRDCRVDDVRVIAGVHGDRDPATGLPLLFKAGAPLPPEAPPLH
jgi:hypothetical protein